MYDGERLRLIKSLLDNNLGFSPKIKPNEIVQWEYRLVNAFRKQRDYERMFLMKHDELTELMGGETEEIDIKGQPAVILMSGLQGSGKTTFSGKLARMLKTKKNKKPLLVACCRSFRFAGSREHLWPFDEFHPRSF